MIHPALVPVRERLKSGDEVTAILFGDSITAGSQIDPDADESIVYHKQWRDALLQLYPRMNLKIINAGVPGHRIQEAHDRVDEEVIRRDPQLVVVEFGINDCWQGADMIDFYEHELLGLVNRIQTGCSAAVILLTANMLNHRVTPEALQMAWFAEKTAKTQNEGWTLAYMDRMRKVAHELDVPLADGYAEWEKARASGIDTDQLLVNGANHPNAEGHGLLAKALTDLFVTP